MEEELNNKHTVSFDVIKKDILIDDENNKGSKRELNDIELTAILIALKMKEEVKDEILGAALIMRSKSLKIKSPDNAIDTCGTGGDMSNSLNISTSASIVAASAGATIAKLVFLEIAID